MTEPLDARRAAGAPGSGLRERKRARVERDLADAALKLFSTRGYDSTTVEEIAEAAGVSPRTFFRYYASKEELLFVFPSRSRPLFFISEERYRAVLSSVLAREDDVDDLAAVGLAFRTLAPEIEQFRDRIIMLNAACATSAALRGRKGDANRQLTSWIQEFVAQRRGRVDPEDEVVARVAMALFTLATERWLAPGGAEDLQSCIGDAFTRLTRVVLAGSSERSSGDRRAVS